MLRHFFALALFACIASSAAFSQNGADSILQPPKGSSVALVVFEDLECPQCRRTAPILEQASKTYKIPVVQHDFLIPNHPWSREAAVLARYFGTQSKSLGVEFRDFIFSKQPEITKDNLRSYADKFASDHKISLPFVIDPDGKLMAAVNADCDAGKAIKLEHTPTVYVVSKNPSRPYVEVQDMSKLYAMIDAIMKN